MNAARAPTAARWISGDRLTGLAMLAVGAAAIYAGYKVYQAVSWAAEEVQEGQEAVRDEMKEGVTRQAEAAADVADWWPDWSAGMWGCMLGVD